MAATKQEAGPQENSIHADSRRKPWLTPRVIVSEVECNTDGGVAALPEASGGVISS